MSTNDEYSNIIESFNHLYTNENHESQWVSLLFDGGIINERVKNKKQG